MFMASSRMEALRFVAYTAWTLVVGATVTVQMCCSVHLNSRAEKALQPYNAFYIMNISVALGGLGLVPQSVCSREPVKKPARWWSMLGGLCSLPAFVSTPAGQLCGIQRVLLAQLLGMLSAALVFDLRRGSLKLKEIWRFGGFGLVALGVTIENLGSSSSSTEGNPALAMVLLAGVFVTGGGYALQAKCTSRLARDVGTTFRATAINALVNTLASLPIDAVICWALGKPPALSLEDWPFWLFVGFQSAFYTGSLAALPSVLGYTAAFLILLVGKLASSTLTDALGVTGTKVPLDWLRCLCLVLVLAGTTLFSWSGPAQAPAEALSGHSISSSLVSFHPSFVATEPDNECEGQRSSLRVTGVGQS